MSEFQNKAENILVNEIIKLPHIDLKKSYYERERRVKKLNSYGYGRQDIFIHYVNDNGNERNICVEIKSGHEDLISGWGLNFTEEYNFLLFEAGHGYSAIRTKHLSLIDDDVGVLVIVKNNLYCLRKAKSKNTKDHYFKTVFSLGIGRSPEEFLVDTINIA